MVEADEQDVAENAARAREAERRWRTAFQDVRARIGTLQQQIPEARRRWQESQDQDEWYRWQAEVGQLEGRLRTAQSELAFLDKAAREQGVPDDWRR
jgi:chromosome segregation ATPase